MWTEAARQASALARSAHATGKAVVNAAHQSGVGQALMHKDRFTNLVPPGSKRDFAVKQAAVWAHAGLVKGAVLAAGGGPVGVAGAMAASYAKWGGDLARKFGPKIAAKVQAMRAKK